MSEARGSSAELGSLVFFKRTANKLSGDPSRLSVTAEGAAQIPLAAAASQRGGHARVGPDHGLSISRGAMTEAKAQQVAKVRRQGEVLGQDIAPLSEAREIVDIRGGDQVVL